MADEKQISKVIFDGDTLVDLTSDTVSEDNLLVGKTAHGKDGRLVEGACAFDADTSSATAADSEILEGSTAFGRGKEIHGSMKNNGSVEAFIDDINEPYTIPIGYHDGGGKVGVNLEEAAKLTPNNIRKGIEILGVLGELEEKPGLGEIQAKTVTPSTSEQVIVPDENYAYLSQVTVEPISYVETENSAGGLTVTIAGV